MDGRARPAEKGRESGRPRVRPRSAERALPCVRVASALRPHLSERPERTAGRAPQRVARSRSISFSTCSGVLVSRASSAYIAGTTNSVSSVAKLTPKMITMPTACRLS